MVSDTRLGKISSGQRFAIENGHRNSGDVIEHGLVENMSFPINCMVVFQFLILVYQCLNIYLS